MNHKVNQEFRFETYKQKILNDKNGKIDDFDKIEVLSNFTRFFCWKVNLF